MLFTHYDNEALASFFHFVDLVDGERCFKMVPVNSLILQTQRRNTSPQRLQTSQGLLVKEEVRQELQ